MTIGAIIVSLPDGAAGLAVFDLACRAVRGELLSGRARQQLAEFLTHVRWASKREIASLENVVAPAEWAALVDEATADELAVLPVAIVEFDGCVFNGPPVDLVHSNFSSVVGGTSTVAEAGGASSASGGGH